MSVKGIFVVIINCSVIKSWWNDIFCHILLSAVSLWDLIYITLIDILELTRWVAASAAVRMQRDHRRVGRSRHCGMWSICASLTSQDASSCMTTSVSCRIVVLMLMRRLHVHAQMNSMQWFHRTWSTATSARVRWAFTYY